MATLAPFDQYQRALAGDDFVWCSNLCAIFSRACNCLGIPCRIIALSNIQATGQDYDLLLAPSHATTEIYDADYSRWVWIDLTFYVLGMQLADCGPINVAEAQRSLNDPGKLAQLMETQYWPNTSDAFYVPASESANLEDLEWYLMPQSILYLYAKGAGAPTYLYSNEAEIFPRRAQLAIASIGSSPQAVGVNLTIAPTGTAASVVFQQTYTSDNSDLAPLQQIAGATLSLTFDDAVAPVGQAKQYEFDAIDESGNLAGSWWLTLYYYSPQFYSANGQTSDGQLVVDSFGFSYSQNQVEDWIVDHPTSDDRAFAAATWGAFLVSDATPAAKAQELTAAILNQLDRRLGASTTLPGTAPFVEYRRIITGADLAGPDDVNSIIAHACNSLGIPARIIREGRGTDQTFPTIEIFDSELNQWVFIDPCDNILGIYFPDVGLLSSADLQHALVYPERLANINAIQYDPTADAVVTMPLVASLGFDALWNEFDGNLPVLYTHVATIAPYPIIGTVIPGDFNGDGKADFVVQGNASLPAYLATGAAGTPFSPVLQWWPGAAYGGWGQPGAKIETGDFNGDGRTDFIVHDAQYGALFTATGDPSQPFQATWLWAPTVHYGDWSDSGATIVTGDFNGDGMTDFIIHDSIAGELFTATGDPSAPFSVTALWQPGIAWGGWGDPGAEIAPGDFDGDGRTDFIIHNSAYAAIYFATGNPAAPFTHLALWNPSANNDGWADGGDEAIIAGDFDGDGKTDFIVHDSTQGALWTATGNRANPFTVTWLWADGSSLGGWGDPGATIVPGDFDGDGTTDFIIYNNEYAALFVGTGIAGYPFYPVSLWNPSRNPDGWSGVDAKNIVAADFNGDGRCDFIITSPRGGALWSATGESSGLPFAETWLWQN
ncbi:MAG TPA: VCBS repeat-containing protein [Candidatus Didemnitutus sp.]